MPLSRDIANFVGLGEKMIIERKIKHLNPQKIETINYLTREYLTLSESDQEGFGDIQKYSKDYLEIGELGRLTLFINIKLSLDRQKNIPIEDSVQEILQSSVDRILSNSNKNPSPSAIKVLFSSLLRNPVDSVVNIRKTEITCVELSTVYSEILNSLNISAKPFQYSKSFWPHIGIYLKEQQKLLYFQNRPDQSGTEVRIATKQAVEQVLKTKI